MPISSSKNTAEYAWKDISVTHLGRELGRLLDIEYTTDVEKKPIYGRGNKALGVQTGNEKASGSYSVGQSELESMIRKAQEISPGAKITDLVFDINVCYLLGADLVRDRIRSINITQFTKGMKQGDVEMIIKLPFVALDIDYNI